MQLLDRYKLAAVLLLAATAPVVLAGESKVTLSGAEEVPAVTTSTTGTATINLCVDEEVTGTLKTSGIEGTSRTFTSASPARMVHRPLP